MPAQASIRLIRHATLVVRYGGRRLLVDPMLAPAEANPPIENTPNDRRNPLVERPRIDLADIEGVLVTHLHSDHFDAAASDALPDAMPLFCQPADADRLRERGFSDVRPIEESLSLGDLSITRTPGRHGYGQLAEDMGPVSGFVLDAPSQPTIYVAGDTVWYDGVAETIEAHQPDAIVLNAGGARFNEGRPITMTDEDVAAVCEAAPAATIIAVHMDAINHCLQTRASLAAALAGTECEGVLQIPEDGERIELE